jgi:hypothetical protein
MVINTAVKNGRGVLANTRTDQCFSTRVLLDEMSDIMNYTSNRHKSSAVLGLCLVSVPIDDGQLLQRNPPVKSLSLLIELLLELLETALLNLVLLELLEIIGEAKLLPDPNRPFRRIVLMPLDGIAVVRWEFVVEIVVALSESDKSRNNVVSGRIAIVEWLITEPVCQGVDAEGSLLNKENTEDSSVDESTPPISPSKTSDKAGKDHAHENDHLDVVTMLPDNDRIVVQVRNVGTANALWVLLHNHPSEMRVEKSLSNGVRVLVGIGVSVVSSVISRPPSNGALNSTTTNGGEKDL